MRNSIRFNAAWSVALMLLCLFHNPNAYAEIKTVVVTGESEYCYARESALNLANIHAKNIAHDECYSLGSDWRYVGNKFPGYSQCFQCGKSDQYKCKVTQAVFACESMKKENEEKAAKARAEKELAVKLAKEKADQERVDQLKKQKEIEEKAAKAREEKELAAKLAKEKADREKADQLKKQKEIEEKAAKVREEKELAAKQAKEMKAPAHDSIDDAFANLDKAKGGGKAKPGGKAIKQGGSGNSIEDAFSGMERQTGKVPTAKTGNIDNEFEKVETYRVEQERLRIAALKARLEREAREQEQKARHDEAVQFCTEAMKSEQRCLTDACNNEPRKTICTQSRRDESDESTSTSHSSGGSRYRLVFPTYTCISTSSNPAYEVWESCTKSMASKCTRSGARPTSHDECVRKKENNLL